jgi:hypothetical protein
VKSIEEVTSETDCSHEIFDSGCESLNRYSGPKVQHTEFPEALMYYVLLVTFDKGVKFFIKSGRKSKSS